MDDSSSVLHQSHPNWIFCWDYLFQMLPIGIPKSMFSESFRLLSLIVWDIHVQTLCQIITCRKWHKNIRKFDIYEAKLSQKSLNMFKYDSHKYMLSVMQLHNLHMWHQNHNLCVCRAWRCGSPALRSVDELRHLLEVLFGIQDNGFGVVELQRRQRGRQVVQPVHGRSQHLEQRHSAVRRLKLSPEPNSELL